MVSKEEYYKFIREELLKDVDESKINKRTLNNSNMIWASIFIFLGIVFLFATYGISAILVMIGIIKIANHDKLEGQLPPDYKERIIKYLLKDYEIVYKENDCINRRIFNMSEFCYRYDDYYGEDYLRIKIPVCNDKNLYFYLCDLTVTETDTDSDGDSHTTTRYSGSFGHIEFDELFKCFLSINTCSIDGEKVKLESISFNKNFKVRSDSQIESRVMLTPVMMEKLEMLSSKQGDIKLLMRGKMFFIGFDRLFEHSKVTKELEEYFDDFYDDIESILAIIDEIKNNNKIFNIKEE